MKNTIEKIEKEISEKTKLPYEVKDKIKKEIFTNIIMAIVIIAYFIFIILGSNNSVKSVRSIVLNVFSFLFLGLAIVLFEIAYRKDKGNLAINGIEALIIAILNLFLPYIIFELDEVYKRNYLLSTTFIAIYYTLKSIYISLKIRNKYMDSISDVKEIVKKEKAKDNTDDDVQKIEEDSKQEKSKFKRKKPKRIKTKEDKIKTRKKKNKARRAVKK